MVARLNQHQVVVIHKLRVRLGKKNKILWSICSYNISIARMVFFHVFICMAFQPLALVDLLTFPYRRRISFTCSNRCISKYILSFAAISYAFIFTYDCMFIRYLQCSNAFLFGKYQYKQSIWCARPEFSFQLNGNFRFKGNMSNVEIILLFY